MTTKTCVECKGDFVGSNRAIRCPDCRILQLKLWKKQTACREDPEQRKVRQARYRAKHAERILERAKEHRNTPVHKERIEQSRDQSRFGGLRQLVLKRDGFRCQTCGIPEIPNTRNLIVHHKDFNPKNNTIENLITLCRRCHPRKHQPTPESNAKIAAALRGRKRGPGKPRTPEQKLKTSLANRGRRASQDTRDKLSEARRRWWASRTPEQRRITAMRIAESKRNQER